MQKTTTHWPSIIILIIVIAGAGLFLLTGLGFAVASVIALATDSQDPAGMMITSLAVGFEALLLIGIAWFVYQRTSGHPKAEEPLRLPFALWHLFAALGIGLFALLIGGLVSFFEIKILAWLVLPILTILLIVPPIWILLGLGTEKLDFGPRWRALGIFGVGMTLGPLIMVTLEIALAVVGVAVAAVFIAGQPEMLDEIMLLATVLENETDPNMIMNALAPYLFNSTVIWSVLGYIALAVPLIEELFKPLGVWLFARKIETPAQGFALGLLSGAAYALIESLGASGQGTNMWPVIVVVRAGTSLLHIVTTGLMGHAIISATRERRYMRLVSTYLLCVLIHGIWNAAAIGASFSAAADLATDTTWTISILPAAVCGIMVLAIGLVILLVVSNRRMRKLAEPVPVASPEPEVVPPAIDEGVK